MAGPWEAFQSAGPQAGPWTAFQSSPEPAPAADPQGIGNALTDMHKEGAKSFTEALQGVTENLNPMARDPQKQGLLESQLQTGKGLLSAAALPLAYPLGAARSLVGHPMASAIQGAGSLINKALGPPSPDYVPPTHEQIFEKIGPDVDAAIGAVGARAPAPRAAPTALPSGALPPAAQPKASDVFSTAKPHYKEFKQAAEGVEIPAQTAADFAGRIRDSLTKANLIPELAPPIYSAVGILDKGEPLTLDALQSVKRVVGRGFQSPDKNVRDAASVASREIGKIMSEVSPAAGQSLKTADEIHSTALAMQDLQRKSDVAGLRAGRAGYGGNSVNSMRQVLSPIVEKAINGRSTLFKPDEISAMRDIVEGTPATNLARGVGQLSPSKGIIQTIASGGATAALGPAALAIPAAGAASNKLATILTGKQIDQLKALVAKRSPAYAEAVSKAATRYEKAQAELASNPSPNKLGAYISASRALSSGLIRDGIAVTSGDLIRAIQGPAKGAAEDEQPEPVGVFNQ